MSRIEGKGIIDWVESEVPSGTINGSNVTFTIANQPTEPMAVEVFLDGLRQVYTTHYSIGGTLNKTITFVTAPAVAQNLWVSYTRETGE